MKTMTSGVLAAFSSLAVTYVFLRFLLTYIHDAKEPPALETQIPFISPIIGMRKKMKFYMGLRDNYNLPIYTLHVPFMRLYIVNSTDLIPIIQRQPRVLDFAPMEAKVAVNVMGSGPEGKEILAMDRDGLGPFSYPIAFDKAIHPAVSPGPKLDAMNRHAVQKVSSAIEEIASQAPKTLKLFEWVKREITLATSEAVYGPKNPFASQDLQNDYCGTFEKGIITLLIGLDFLVKESVKARTRIVDAFNGYFSSHSHEQGSAFVQAHYGHKVDFGISGKDIARFEIGGMVAILSNTIPASFWVLYHLISDPVALEDCRKEVYACCKSEGDTCTLDVTEVKARCPMLLSTLKESLRFHGIGTSVRVVTRDYLLDGKYFLKKGGIVMIPGPVQHSNKEAYGETVDQFQHRRFMKLSGGKRPNPIAFRGFGGGSTLCPGRHFASTEILSLVAQMIVRFDFEPAKGVWVCPKTDRAGMQGTIAPPDNDVEVRITPATGILAGKKWNVVLSGSDRAVELSAEDIN
ncbi:cytochrome P450 [Lojkania enalia]|uniref:Cytochrome P450 n=1 Tax=Lojkania enalia TaxID=147567 RepID=A0A9P4KDM2_9PLEO|nr:cytochrome P450 [Didymosphaeria enalia]